MKTKSGKHNKNKGQAKFVRNNNGKKSQKIKKQQKAAEVEEKSSKKQQYKPPKVKTGTAEEKMMQSKFRFLNEQLYTQSSVENGGAVKMFMSEPKQFEDYHDGYRQQV